MQKNAVIDGQGADQEKSDPLEKPVARECSAAAGLSTGRVTKGLENAMLLLSKRAIGAIPQKSIIICRSICDRRKSCSPAEMKSGI